ncbi:UNVERIFIED_CONTAM: hypothetical protein GTU68_027308 [Idotea baltica]|nr:hypothetical protein [Idotea baltica]
MKVFNNKFLTPKGFLTSGVNCGIKDKKNDLSLIYSTVNCIHAKAVTKNKIKAAPLQWNKTNNTKNDDMRAIITNSGNANAGTGKEGLENCDKIADKLSKSLEISKSQIILSSTGVIGEQLPIVKINGKIENLVSVASGSEDSSMEAAKAILTTDTCEKIISVEFEINKKVIRISGMAKGSGMIHPNMATMLAYVATDANISSHCLNSALKLSVQDTFNMISVDADTSTNDMLVALANREAKNNEIKSIDSQEYKEFYKAFNLVNLELAKKIVKDGEGATKTFEVKTFNVATKEVARSISKSVIKSSLVKTAIFGNDLNWGRILCAIGNSSQLDSEIDIDKLEVSVSSTAGEINVFKNGSNLKFNEKFALKLMKGDELLIKINMNDGEFSANAFGCDLTYDYVKINADYRS